ncbi:J domain-containing protein [Acidisphaera rubrifaciens]|uniref:J domain-containing protein n=1 Tax=Acidisphaera rubrifaciens HS-AP3 TaxID=1231350 RepID=A0A0D6P8N1_9PROT|nr:J domain-containing protein [Acidisphaera rubrifaciens]GAN77578.1 hypothetical protein Asru_0382_03 [Acidisphaera rubrifaciens HS-AP3]
MTDPKGYYATLGVDPDASAALIHAAFRSKAKQLHPDVPVTGNAGAFMRVKEAYEVLSNGLTRNEYDRLAHDETLRRARWAADTPSGRNGGSGPDGRAAGGSAGGYGPAFGGAFGDGGAFAGMGGAGRGGPGSDGTASESGWGEPGRPSPWPSAPPSFDDISELSDVLEPVHVTPSSFVMPVRLPVLMAAVLAVVVLGGIGGAVWQLTRPITRHDTDIRAAMTGTLPDSPPAADPGPPLTGTPGSPVYVLPVAGAATLWDYDREDRHFRPQMRLAPFTALSLLRLVSHGALAEVRLPDDRVGYVYPHLLAPGDAREATRQRCIYDAGPTPRSGERLDPRPLPPAAPANVKDPGPDRVLVTNTADSPAVFVLQAADGIAAIYVGAHAEATIAGLPPQRWRIAYAIGDLWSRRCFRFMAGERAQRLPDGPLAPAYVLPSPAGIDIPDDVFKHK